MKLFQVSGKNIPSLSIQTCFFLLSGESSEKSMFCKVELCGFNVVFIFVSGKNDAPSLDLFGVIFFPDVSLFYDSYVCLFIYNTVKNFIEFSCAENFCVLRNASPLFADERLLSLLSEQSLLN